jgi:hypothetical protein|tara:strand:- start:27 stop:245 length:219 start_codon:yes stop_codon:yes gene_type:complete
MTQRLKAKVKAANRIVAQTVKVGSGLRLGDLSDVDVTNQSDGVMMIFNSSTGNYEVTTQIQNENLNIIGGTY